MTFSVALLQISPTEVSPEFNLEKGIDACRKAKALGGRPGVVSGNVEYWVRLLSARQEGRVGRKSH